jgi:hypothetical protein
MSRSAIFTTDYGHESRMFAMCLRAVTRQFEQWETKTKRESSEQYEEWYAVNPKELPAQRMTLHGEGKKEKRQVFCRVCGIKFEYGDKVFSAANKSKGVRYMHTGCAMNISRISDEDDMQLIEQKTKERNLKLYQLRPRPPPP